MKTQIKSLLACACLAVSSVGCGGQSERNASELSEEAACEWLVHDELDPAVPEAHRPSGSGERDVCYLLWTRDDSARIALIASGASAGDVSCAERMNALPAESDPLLVRPGQVALVFARAADPTDIGLQSWVCSEMDLAIEYGAEPADLVDGLWDSREGR